MPWITWQWNDQERRDWVSPADTFLPRIGEGVELAEFPDGQEQRTWAVDDVNHFFKLVRSDRTGVMHLQQEVVIKLSE